MLLTLILFFLSLMLIGITTVPVFISLIVVCAVIFKRSWLFFLAAVIGFFLDLFLLRLLGQTGLFLAVFVLLIFLYERKFETQTLSFVLLSSFLGSFFYLWLFKYQMVLLQSLITALLSVLIFYVILNLFQDPTKHKTEMLK